MITHTNSLPVNGCIHCRPDHICEYHKASNNPVAGEPPRAEETPLPIPTYVQAIEDPLAAIWYLTQFEDDPGLLRMMKKAATEITAHRQQVKELQDALIAARHQLLAETIPRPGTQAPQSTGAPVPANKLKCESCGGSDFYACGCYDKCHCEHDRRSHTTNGICTVIGCPCVYGLRGNAKHPAERPALAGEPPREGETPQGCTCSDEDGMAVYSADCPNENHAITALRQQVKELQDEREELAWKGPFNETIDHFRSMAARFAVSRDELKHENRKLEAEVQTRDEQIAQLREALERIAHGWYEEEVTRIATAALASPASTRKDT